MVITPDFLTCSSLCRLIFVSNHLPLIVNRDEVHGWVFEWDEDALIAQAKEGLPEDMDAVYVGCLPVDVAGHEQDVSYYRVLSLWPHSTALPSLPHQEGQKNKDSNKTKKTSHQQ